MLLTTSSTHQPAEDLGYLLDKHPERLHEFTLPFGLAHVFCPEANFAGQLQRAECLVLASPTAPL